jgi:glycosyltransferase involved in cell wall biosynthesis
MRIALQNFHLLPNLFNIGIHDYMLDLIRHRYVTVLYFSDYNPKSWKIFLSTLIRNSRNRNKIAGIPWHDIEFVFTAQELKRKSDVLLNINMMYMNNLKSEFSYGLRKYDGLKIFHVGDYFWNHPGSELNKYLNVYGVDHLLGYSMHDRYCSYFQKTFPKYRNKVWGIPFGFAPRFVDQVPFIDRNNKVVALGSVNPLRPLHEPVYNFIDTADYFPDESWMHKFRRLLVLNKQKLGDVVDSMLPEFPIIKDFKYDIVNKFNEYKMFVTCESIFFFPVAKTFEGSACGTVLVCADIDCNREYGFEDQSTCIMYNLYDLDDFKDKIKYYQNHTSELSAISKKAKSYVRTHYAHKNVARHLVDTIKLIWEKSGNIDASPLATRLPDQ